jgi:cardiolipin synthase A/B
MSATEPVTPERPAHVPRPLPTAIGELAFVRSLWRVAGARATDGNDVALLVDGPHAFSTMLSAIESARDEIALESYIFYDDDIGRRFADALRSAARRGVHTRVLVDWIGSLETPRRFWNELRQGDVDLRLFGRPALRAWLSLVPRDHRKVLVVDRRVGFTGGFGIGDEWNLGEVDDGKRLGRWRDTGVRIEGPAASDMRDAFTRTWNLAGNRRDTEPVIPPVPLEPEPQPGAIVGIVEGLPMRLRAERGFHFQTAVAGQSIWIANAYFIPARHEIEALCLAAHDGIDVRILVPRNYDHGWIRRFTRRTYRRLLDAGIRIWEWQGTMMHAKTHVVDRMWVRVGSSDLNPLAVLVNHELDAAICDSDLGEEAADLFLRDLRRSREITIPPADG